MSAAPPDAADAGPGPGPRPRLYLAVLLGGCAGTAIRIGTGEALADDPIWATLLVNLAGALVLGWLYERLREQRLRGLGWWALLGPGLCGALTTFSGLQLDAVELARDAGWGAGALYLAATLGLGVPAAALGRRLGRIA